MTIHRPKNSILLAVSHLLIFGFIQAKDYDVSGQVFDSNGDKAGKVTVLLLDNSELEVQSTTAKGNGKFKFKKVLSGEYIIRVDGGELGKANIPVTVAEDDIKGLEVALQQTTPPNVVTEEAPPAAPTKSAPVAAAASPINDGPLVPEAAAQDEPQDAGSTYIMNELSFEIKKLSAEVKHLSSELENLKSLSKMWVNPLAIYSKEIIMKNGSTVFGKIVYQDESELKVETLVGYLIIKRD
ncbi:MAG: carboxypeptidase regulatory-like domain-containing protein, partial [Candidatus Neomarinimicrobiota bacterium]|nr:carboxypeptidase regulatory-like domain-containing protein [Candidatus Neomarinimicrobiota bacterium]